MKLISRRWDTLIFTSVTLILFVTVMLYDFRDLAGVGRDVGDAGTLNGAGALYAARSEDSRSTQASAARAEDGLPPALPRERPPATPAPFEAGVVQLGQNASLGGKRPFPDDNPWNQPVDDLPVDPLSDVIINRIGRTKHVHPDFGAAFWNNAPNGIPYVVVDKLQALAPVIYTLYGEESDPGPFPIPYNAPIEGDPSPDGDRHVIVVDRDNWKLYELFRAFPVAEGRLWRAECGAVFDMNTNDLRPEGWTSADAAGLPIFPGLVRYEEVVEQKEIRHALRFTVNNTRRAYVPPARHWASRSKDVGLPPMGMRVRLKSNFDQSGFPPEAQVVLTALKKYGMFLADNGGDWFLSGAPDPRWNDEALRTLRKVHGDDFEVVLMEGLVEDQ